MQHYQLGQKVGEFTITSYNYDSNYYTLTCTCGSTSEGDSTHVTRKISNLMTDGFTSCMNCYYKTRATLQDIKQQNANYYTFKDVYREYIKKSKERNIHFELSLEEASALFNKPCTYCNRAPSNSRKRDTGHTVFYQGIDRIDNTIGYTNTNVVPCCKYCNSFKMDRTHSEFLTHIEEIYVNQVQRSSRKGVEPSGSKWESPHPDYQEGEDMI